jgi:hypothetical protein
MKKQLPFFILFLICTVNFLFAQDTLPKFSVKNVGNNRIVIGWVNKFESIKQISIQRSFDSLKNFKSIHTLADPAIPENGYVDTKAPNDHMFYRLYIQLDKGVYLFSDPKRPKLDTAVTKRANNMTRPDNPGFTIPVIPVDTLSNGPVISNNRPKPEVWVPSKFVYTYKDGYIRISLPDEAAKKYSLKFFTSEGEPLFELKEIKERSFKIDKPNFYRSGWFKFELYEDGELKEKNKFFLPKEF